MKPYYSEALLLAKGIDPTPKNIERVAAKLGAEGARWAFNQWELRRRGQSKFRLAEQMLFDRDGLEMASHEEISSGIHTDGFPKDATIGDLTTGIGADTIALSKVGEVTGYETNQERAEMALHNLSVYGRSATVHTQDCLTARWKFDAAFADPARRASGRRTLDPAEFSPRLDDCAARLSDLELGVIKLSPMLQDGVLDSVSTDRVFVSHQSECKEVLCYLGKRSLANDHLRGIWAYHVESQTWSPTDIDPAAIQDEPLDYVYEADPAMIRAHALASLRLPLLADSNGYLTSREMENGTGLKTFTVLWSGKYGVREIKTALAGTGKQVQVVKSRGVSIDVDQVRKQVFIGKGESVVLMLYPLGKSIRAVIAVPV